MKRFFSGFRLTLVMLLITLVFGACNRSVADVSFGGFKATYELDQSQFVNLNEVYLISPSPEESIVTEEVQDTPVAASLSNRSETNTPEDSQATTTFNLEPGQTPIATNIPSQTNTPRPTPSNHKEAFFTYWEGIWFFWFEESGRLLEGKLEFVVDNEVLSAKVDIDNKIYAFLIKYLEDQDLYESFVFGEWFLDDMQNGNLFRLKPQNETQAAGHHSQPSKTFCLSRDASQRPEPCFLQLSN